MSFLLIYGRPAAFMDVPQPYFAEQLLERMRDNLICIT